MRLTLGPILYFWERARVFEFYDAVAGWPVERVCLGETVCAKRRALRSADWLALARDLAACGKEVVLSQLALVEARSEAGAMRRLCEQGWPVEANDFTAVGIAEELGVPFIGGHALNLYNRPAIARLAAAGMGTWVAPLELDADGIAAVTRNGLEVEAELFAFGRLPLAWSARCFAARAHGRSKDDCGFVCREDPDGLPLRTREGEDFLVINGIQTQSAGTLDLLPNLARIRRLGIDSVRLSPQARHMADVVRAWDGARNGAAPCGLPREWLAGIPFDGLFRGVAGIDEPALPS